jgi:para-nitrobenzyl esterase
MDPIVETRHGKLRGLREDGLTIFRGIPFAAPPVGSRRFGPPQPAAPWAGVRDATRFGPSAPQRPVPFDFLEGMDVGPTDEDCLTLNIYTPGADGERRPVLVWIHGGAFTIGSGSQRMYDARPLAKRGGVVVVTVNYRLGALGFLPLEDEDAAPNAGLLDQAAALRFVRENVAAFGGDPANVTIFGESAGGMSVGCLLGMPGAAGLFDRAVPMSGAAHQVNAPDTAARVRADFCRELGVRERDLAALRAAPVDAILAAQARTEAGYLGAPTRLGFRPSVDGRSLPKRPIETIRAGLSAEVPVLVGATRDEWKLFGLMDPGAFDLDADGLLRRVEARAPGHGARLVDAYRGARPGAPPGELFFAIESDRLFRIPAVRLAEAQSAHQERTFAYLFTWESPMLGGRLGACHGIDVPFVFGLIGTPGGEKFAGGGPAAHALADDAMGAWLAFARSGAPAHAGLPDWPRFEGSRRATMLLGPRCEIAHDPQGAERAAWDGVIV